MHYIAGQGCRTEYYTSCNHGSDPSPRAGAPPTPVGGLGIGTAPIFPFPPLFNHGEPPHSPDGN